MPTKYVDDGEGSVSNNVFPGGFKVVFDHGCIALRIILHRLYLQNLNKLLLVEFSMEIRLEARLTS